MNRSIMIRLIAKDLYLYRWLIASITLAGLASLLLSGMGDAMGYVGDILLITCIVVLGVFLAIYGLLTERSTKSLLFVLSLPLSPMQYVTAKVAACLIAFLMPWLVITVALVGFTLMLDSVPDGNLPFVVTMMVFLFANFCILLAIGLIGGSELWAVAGIIATNTSVPIVLGTVLRNIAESLNGPVAVWNPAILVTLGVAAAVIVLSLGLAFYVQSRKKDYV